MKIIFIFLLSLVAFGCATHENEADSVTSKAQQSQEEAQQMGRIDSVDDYPLTEEIRDGYREL